MWAGRHEAEGISLLKACSQNFPEQPCGAPSQTQPGFDPTFPAPLGTAGQQPRAGPRPQTPTWKCPWVFLCVVHQTPGFQHPFPGSLGGKWLLVCFKLRLSRSALKGTQRQFGTRVTRTKLWWLSVSKELFCSHQKPPWAWRGIFTILSEKGCATAVKAEQLHHIPAFPHRSGKRNAFLTPISKQHHAPCGLLLRVKIAISVDLPNSNSSCLKSFFSLLKDFIVWGTFRPDWGQFPSPECPRDKWTGGASCQTLPSAEPSSSSLISQAACAYLRAELGLRMCCFGYFPIPAQRWIFYFFLSEGKEFSATSQPGEFISNGL